MNTDISQSEIKLLLCPYCKEQIPLVSFEKKQEGLIAKIRCSCLKEEEKTCELDALIKELRIFPKNLTTLKCSLTNHDTPANMLCLQCAKFLCQECLDSHQSEKDHQLVDYNIIINCQQHHFDFSHYCHQCHQNICLKCETSHQGHQLIPISNEKIQPFEEDINTLCRSYNRNIRNIERFIQKLRDKIEEDKQNVNEEDNDNQNNNQLISWKEELNILFDRNLTVNNQLKEFMQYLKTTMVAFKTHPIFALMMSLQTIQFNQELIYITDWISEYSFNQSKNYLPNNYIIEINDSADDLSKEQIKSYSLVNHGNKHNECIKTISKFKGTISCLLLMNDKVLAISFYNGDIKLIDITTSEYITTLQVCSYCVYCIIKINDEVLASGSKYGLIKFWNIITYDCITNIAAHDDGINCLLKLNDKTLASTSSDNTIKVWNYLTSSCIATLREHNESVSCLIQTMDKRLVSGSLDQTLKVWNYHDSKAIITLTGHTDCVFCLCELNNNTIASGSNDRTIKLWNIESYTCIQTLIGHENGLKTFLLFNESTLISGSYDKTIKLWNLKSSECISTLTEHTHAVSSLIRLKDNMIVSGSYDETIKIWVI